MKKSALVIIDVQNDYFPGGVNELTDVVKAGENCRKALDFFRNQNLPVFFIQHVNDAPQPTFFAPGSRGVEIYDKIKPQTGESVIVKHAPSSFYGTSLAAELEEKGITHLVIVGMMTHMCVDTTVRAAKDYGYEMTVLSDACATKPACWNGEEVPAEQVQNVYMASLAEGFAQVVTTEAWLQQQN